MVNISAIDIKPTAQISPATILAHIWEITAIKSSTITLLSIGTFSFAIATRSIWGHSYIVRNFDRLDIFKPCNSRYLSELLESIIGPTNCLSVKKKKKKKLYRNKNSNTEGGHQNMLSQYGRTQG